MVALPPPTPPALIATPDVHADAPAPMRRILFSGQGTFGPVFVVDEDGVRSLRFGGETGTDQSAFDPLHPDVPVFEYIRVASLALPVWLQRDSALRRRQPRALVLGLGGAAWPRVLLHRHPGIVVDGVEIDPVVVEAARAHLGFPTDARLRVHLDDAARFVRRAPAGAKGTPATWDLILLDAFSGSGIPEPLRAPRFFADVKKRLARGGIAVMNIALDDDAEMDRLEARFAKAFDAGGTHCFSVRSAHEENRVLFAGPRVGLMALHQAIASSDVTLGFDVADDVEGVAACQLEP